jgi:hypothetical protein
MRFKRYQLPGFDKLIDPDVDIDNLPIWFNPLTNSTVVLNQNNDHILTGLDYLRLLNSDALHFIHTELPWQLLRSEIFILPPNSRTNVVQEVTRADYAHVNFICLVGGVSWNTYDVRGFRRRLIEGETKRPEAWPGLCGFTKADVDMKVPNNWENFLDTDQMPVEEQYKNCQLLGATNVPHGASGDASQASFVVFLTFEIPSKDPMDNYMQQVKALSPWEIHTSD